MRQPPCCLFRKLIAASLVTALSGTYIWAQGKNGGCASDILDRATGFTSLSNGIAVQAGEWREEITALRPDVLHIRVYRERARPEDSSWAVLSSARLSSAPVTPDNSAGQIGFRTQSLHVEIDRSTLRLKILDLAGNIIQQDARSIHLDGSTFRIYKSMPQDEHYFGLGDKTGPLDRRDEAFTLWNTDAYRFQESTDPLYKSIPFFITYRAGVSAGILLDNTWRSSFDFGKELPGVYSFGAVNGPVNYYFIYGPSAKQVVETYTWLTGTPPLPPMWALGFQQSRFSYSPQSRVLEIADRLRHDRIPADAIYLDIGFQNNNRPFTVDPEHFPDLAAMVTKLNADNFHVVAITDLHIAELPHHGYVPYDSGLAGDNFVKNPDGTTYVGKVWPGPSVFPDFTRQQTRAWWGTLYRNLYQEGVAGFWNDMNEPAIFNTPSKTMPLDVVHRIDEPGFATRTASHAEIHNVYGMENSRATFDGLKTIKPDIRPFVLTRATYAGGQRYAATWTGDNSSSWNHLRLATPMLENLGLSGFAFSGDDVGGYAGTPQVDLLTKWLEIAAFQPIDRDHTEAGTADQEPWAGGEKQEAIRRQFIEERYRLMPYLYTLAEEASRTGVPIMRPLFLEFPDATPDRHPIDIDTAASGEFLFGPDLLVAAPPYPDELDNYPVEFPSSDWYDYWTGERLRKPNAGNGGGGAKPEATGGPTSLTIQIHPQVTSLPVYVRAGAVLPIAPLVQSTNQIPKGALTLRVYAGEHCGGNLYLDDGKTYAYQHGAYLRMAIDCHATKDSFQLHIGAHQGSYPAWWKDIRVELYGWNTKQPYISVNGARTHVPWKRDAQSIKFTVADNGQGSSIELK